MKTILTFPRMGMYTSAFEKLLGKLGVDYILPPPITKRTIEIGTEELDELMCYPAKTTLGNFTEAIEKGANTLVMFSEEGDCRFKNYYKMHELILRKKNYKFRMCPFKPWSVFKDLKRIDKSITTFKIIKAINSFWKEIIRLEKEDLKKNPRNPILKVLITGEIYCVNENKVNMDLIKKLRGMNVYVDFAPKLSHYVTNLLPLNHFEKREEKKEAKEYLPHKRWAGHGFDTLYEIIYHIKNGYDGIFHVYPFPCMPNSTITKYIDLISEKYNDFPIQHLQCDEFSGEAGFDTRVEAFVDGLKFKKYGIDLHITNKGGYWLGIDIGSVSSKAAIIDQDNKVIASSYILISGNPIEGVRKCLNGLPTNFKISGVGTTGSARYLVSEMVGADVIVNEVTAQTLGSINYNKKIRSIIEIGGLDSKCIFIKDGVPIWHNLNSKCAAGTGSFLMREAERINMPIGEFGDCGLKSKMDINIASKCTVFAGQDCIHKAQIGFKKEEIVNGLHNGLVRNFINSTARNKKLEHPIIFNGGVAANKGVVKSFNEYFKSEIIVPEHHKIMGCIGAAISSKNTNETKFKGFEVKDFKCESKSFQCSNCSNNCEIVGLYQQDKLIYRTSGICRRWEL